jgi:lysyl-tRNA synthetase class I
MENKKFYLTTAIAYTSRKPHIGNAYDIVLADMIARYKRMQGYDVHFLTGSDEHGQKIQQYAEEQGISPKEYVDAISQQIKDVWNKLNTSYDLTNQLGYFQFAASFLIIFLCKDYFLVPYSPARYLHIMMCSALDRRLSSSMMSIRLTFLFS